MDDSIINIHYRLSIYSMEKDSGGHVGDIPKYFLILVMYIKEYDGKRLSKHGSGDNIMLYLK